MVSLSNRRSLDNPDIGTIVLHRLANVEGVTISATSAMAPNNAKKAYEKGLNEARKEKWENAEKELWKAVDIYPKYASAWYHLGNVQQKQKNFDAARNSYSQSLAADSRFVAPYQQLAEIYAREQKWPQVVDATDRLLRLNPVEFPQAWYYNAVGNYQLHNVPAAEKSIRETLAADTAHRISKAEYLLGLILAAKHDLTGAAEHLRAYIKLAPDAPEIDKVKQQLAEMEQATSAQASEKKPE
jgi:tetratricopeptide (TPR) repeat protein